MKNFLFALIFVVAFTSCAFASDDDVYVLKAKTKRLEREVQYLKQDIRELERKINSKPFDPFLIACIPFTLIVLFPYATLVYDYFSSKRNELTESEVKQMIKESFRQQ